MAEKKKILFISYDGLTDPLGQSQVIPYLAGLTKYNYEFTILSCDKPALYKKNKDYVEKLIAPYPIKWVSVPYHKNPPVLSSIFDFYQLKKKAKNLHKKERFDMVHTRPGVPTLVALWLKKKYGIKFLNDVRGFWADERVDGGMWNLKNPVFKKIYTFFKKHEYECLEKSDYTTCLTYHAKTEMHSWKNISNQPIPIEVIPCSVDMDLFNPGNIDATLKERLKIELKISDEDLIVSYLGSIGGWYLTEEMMQFCKTLLTKIPKTKFLFISPHRHEVIIDTAKKYNIPADRIMVKKGARHEVPVLLSFSNYSLFFIKPCYSKISSSPTKHGEIMAMGMPVITNAGVGDVEEITTKYNAGIVLKTLNPIAYEKAAELIAGGKIFNKQEIIQGAKEYYNLEKAIQTYLKVYKSILEDS
ncbi:MAG: glycosyltransferase family 4 protein [Chitinophagaceae bacterium]|nr:glycosyltransferase family 4 protein [Chitinophagaceae bacterium]MDB5222728.1 glycosyltransferase family 4 protein [Chitinophagaceae bacterium]